MPVRHAAKPAALPEFLRDLHGEQVEFFPHSFALVGQDGRTYLLNAVAGYRLGGDGRTQESFARAWVTEPDGLTPAKADRIDMEFEVGGEHWDVPTVNRGAQTSAIGRGYYEHAPMMITLRARFQNPDGEIIVRTDR